MIICTVSEKVRLCRSNKFTSSFLSAVKQQIVKHGIVPLLRRNSHLQSYFQRLNLFYTFLL